MKHIATILLALAATATAAVAQTPRQWTLRDCMVYAVEHSPTTNIAEARNEIRRQEYIEAIGRLLPSLNASTRTNWNFGRGLDPSTNTYTTINTFANTYSASTGLTIFAGMTGVNNLRMRKINRATGLHELQQRRDEVAYATMDAYMNVLYYKQMVILATSQLEESRMNLHQTERMAELGMKGFPDVAEMRAQEAANSYRLTEQQNLLTIGIILLKEAMNFPVEEALDIAPLELPDAPAAKTPETAAGIYVRALSYLPKALGAESAAESSRIALQVARGQRFPTISVNGGYSTDFSRRLDSREYDSFADQFRNNRGFYVGASLNIPIFNGFQTSTGIRRSKYSLDIARIERDATLRTLYTEIEQAVADMNGYADQHTQALRQREATSVAHDVNQRKYEEGLVSALEMHTSSNRLVEARATELRARLAYILKKRLVEYYAGVPMISETEN